MRRRHVWVLLAAVILLLFVGAMSGMARQRDAWEYSISDDASVAELNRLGTDGWEATAAAQDSGGRIRVVLKRRKN